jgi:hypothetical protein
MMGGRGVIFPGSYRSRPLAVLWCVESRQAKSMSVDERLDLKLSAADK